MVWDGDKALRRRKQLNLWISERWGFLLRWEVEAYRTLLKDFRKDLCHPGWQPAITAMIWYSGDFWTMYYGLQCYLMVNWYPAEYKDMIASQSFCHVPIDTRDQRAPGLDQKAGRYCAKHLLLSCTFWSSCLHLPSAKIAHMCATMPLGGVGNGAQSFVYARETLHQPSHILSPTRVGGWGSTVTFRVYSSYNNNNLCVTEFKLEVLPIKGVTKIACSSKTHKNVFESPVTGKVQILWSW